MWSSDQISAVSFVLSAAFIIKESLVTWLPARAVDGVCDEPVKIDTPSAPVGFVTPYVYELCVVA